MPRLQQIGKHASSRYRRTRARIDYGDLYARVVRATGWALEYVDGLQFPQFFVVASWRERG